MFGIISLLAVVEKNQPAQYAIVGAAVIAAIIGAVLLLAGKNPAFREQLKSVAGELYTVGLADMAALMQDVSVGNLVSAEQRLKTLMEQIHNDGALETLKKAFYVQLAEHAKNPDELDTIVKRLTQASPTFANLLRRDAPATTAAPPAPVATGAAPTSAA